MSDQAPETARTTAFDRAERRMWAGKAAAYGAGFARLCAHPVPRLLDAAGVGAGTYLLDVGTGTGTVALAAQERGARVRAVDAEPAMAEAAQARGVAADVAALPELPFPDQEFGAVVGNSMKGHAVVRNGRCRSAPPPEEGCGGADRVSRR